MVKLLEEEKSTGSQKDFWNLFWKISPKCKIKGSVIPSMKRFFNCCLKY